MQEKLKSDWMINGLLAVIVVLLASHYAGSTSQSALAEGGGWETSGVMIGSTGTPQERLVLVDTKKQSIMVYRARPGGGFGLSGIRNYKYDVEMQDTGTTRLPGGNNGWTYTQTALEYLKSH